MSKRDPKPLLVDMLQCIDKLLEFTKGLSYEDFLKDSKTRDAVLRNIQVLGEAANRVPDDFKNQHPEIEWSKIIRSRHILTHEYDRIDYSIVWRIVSTYVLPLKGDINKIYSNLD